MQRRTHSAPVTRDSACVAATDADVAGDDRDDDDDDDSLATAVALSGSVVRSI